MTTLRGLFDPKPRSKRNFLLENIRDVSKETQRKKLPAKSKELTAVDNQPKVLLPKMKLLNSQKSNQKNSRNKQLSQEYVQQSRYAHSAASCIRQDPSLAASHNESFSQTPCEFNSIHRQTNNGTPTEFPIGEELSPMCKYTYIDEENVPFRWTQVCPSIISHSVCHQAVQTLSEEDLASLLQDGPTKYPSFDKNPPDANDNVLPAFEWPAYADEDNALPVGSARFAAPPSMPPLESLRQNGTDGAQSDATCNTTKGRNRASQYSGKRAPPTNNQHISQFERDRKDLRSCAPVQADPINKGFVNRVTRTEETRSPSISHQSSLVSQDARLDRAGELKESLSETKQPLKADIYDSTNRKADQPDHMSLRSNGESSRPPSNYQRGVLPKYLVRRKNEQRVLSRKSETDDETISPNEERLRTLEHAKKEYDTLVTELNKLPVRTDTLRTKTRKIELEKELDLLERRIRSLTRISD